MILIFDQSHVKGLETVYYGTTWVTLTRPFVVWSMENTLARNFLLYLTAAHLDYDPVTGFPSIFEEVYQLPFFPLPFSFCLFLSALLYPAASLFPPISPSLLPLPVSFVYVFVSSHTIKRLSCTALSKTPWPNPMSA